MKKSLIALAVLAGSGAAMAQSSVTMYGIADVYVGFESRDGQYYKATDPTQSLDKYDESNTVLQSGGVNAAVWGLKGSEDLGGGLKANFDFQAGFSRYRCRHATRCSNVRANLGWFVRWFRCRESGSHHHTAMTM